MKEDEIIGYFYPEGDFPLDDCHFQESGILVTTDSLVEGTHFRLDWSRPADIASKLVEVNVSDVLSCGGVPEFAFLNLGLSPETTHKDWIEEFSSELLRSCQNRHLKLVGGDSFRSPSVFLAMTIQGKLHPKLLVPWSRNQGKPGDHVYITGAVGYSQWGYEILSSQKAPLGLEKRAIQKHLSPKSRWDLLETLLLHPIHACMDITDGLTQDLPRLARASGLELEIHVDALPEWGNLSEYLNPDQILSSGEELELVFLSPLDVAPKEWEKAGIQKIGKARKITPESKDSEDSLDSVDFLWNGERILRNELGFLHFT